MNFRITLFLAWDVVLVYAVLGFLGTALLARFGKGEQ